jgi:hypothetical protein
VAPGEQAQTSRLILGFWFEPPENADALEQLGLAVEPPDAIAT